MKPPSFDYADPGTVAEVVSLLAQHEGEAKLIAGGQSLMPLLNMRLARPGLLVDLRKVRDLDYIRETDGGLAIGATTTQRTVERSAIVERCQPMLHAAVRFIAHPQIRNRGTIGGSLAHADPAAELPAIAVALDAAMQVTGRDGTRSVSAADFFVTYLTTSMAPTELLAEVRLPARRGRCGWSFMEIARRHGDYAMAGIATTITLGDGDRCADARVVLFGVGATPVRAGAAEQALVGERLDQRLIERVGQAVGDQIDEPLTDVHATADYRRDLARVLTRRGLSEALARAQGRA
jgi:CO/xanthine dehydrogenase FAD-binding subunit